MKGAVWSYRQALALAEELGCARSWPTATSDSACSTRRAGTRQEAREHITAAGRMFGEMDTRFWLERAESEMRELP